MTQTEEKTILITGGAGFIGSCFVRRMVADGSEVVTLDKLTYAGNPDSLNEVADCENYSFVQVDIADFALAARLLEKHQPTAIDNDAAESHVDRSIDGPRCVGGSSCEPAPPEPPLHDDPPLASARQPAAAVSRQYKPRHTRRCAVGW